MNEPAKNPGTAPTPARWHIGVLAVAVVIFWIIASRVTLPWSQRFYLMVPWIFVTHTILGVATLGWRHSVRPVVAVALFLVVLVGVWVYELRHPDASWPPLERTTCAYGLLSVLIVTSWLWMLIGEPIRRRLTASPTVTTWRRIGGRVIAILVYVLVLYPYLLSFLQTHWPKRLGPMSPHRLHLDCDDITWHSYDGTRIAGWFVRANDSDRTAIVCHGVAADKSDMIDFVVALHEAGYNVLAFDFRGHGASEGHTVSFGWYEKEDIRSGIDMLRRRFPARCRRIVGVGWSMGAASLILAAAEDKRIEALHVDAVYARTRDIAGVLASQAPPIMRQLAVYLGTAMASIESRTNLFTLSPAGAVSKFAPRPIMLIHGDRDAIVPISQGRLTFEAAGEPKSWHVVQGAGHCQTIAIGSPKYEQRMVDFLDDALKR